MNNYKLIIQYDGTEYAGWQIQNETRTIQQTITDSIETITKEKVNLIGSGRTDSGVHALGQAANFRIGIELDLYKFKHSLNAVLPNDISVLSIQKIHESFHARFDAKKRTYIYLISRYKSPFFRKYSYSFHGELNLPQLNTISKLFLGDKDYTSFTKKNDKIDNKVCEVFNAAWYDKNELIVFEISANRFLHGMVRTITGTILKASEIQNSKEYIEKMFSEMDRESAPMAVPANGLFLFKVEY
ncbi:MAG TPA: tRNA pseudouridine(38-40) synthase TruA [Ignavibacteriaceae bacterium]|nr:tRNA pseudouridine(38-40) synthase TruA [Ignavibacteriaceae bacterium]